MPDVAEFPQWLKVRDRAACSNTEHHKFLGMNQRAYVVNETAPRKVNRSQTRYTPQWLKVKNVAASVNVQVSQVLHPAEKLDVGDLLTASEAKPLQLFQTAYDLHVFECKLERLISRSVIPPVAIFDYVERSIAEH
jgi:hypothetical protein